MLVTLKSNNAQYDLYKNAKVEIVMPNSLKVNVKNITQLNMQDQLQITNPRTYKNANGEQIISLELAGEQVEFANNINEGVQISITSDIDIEKSTPTTKANITMNYQNENRPNETFSTQADLKLNSKYGVLMVNKLSNYNNDGETLESVDDKVKKGKLDVNSESKDAKAEVAVVNNYETDITDIALIGKISGLNGTKINNETVKSTFEMNLKQAINVDGKSAKVYYSEDENLSKDSDKWTENISDLSNVKTFKIVPEDNKISTGETLKVSYDLQIPENLGNNESTYTNLAVTYNYLGNADTTNSTIDLQTAEVQEEQGANVVSEEKDKMKVELIGRTAGDVLTEGQEVYEGQGIKYLVKITNNTDQEMKNVKVKAEQTNAIFYTEKEYNDGWDSAAPTEEDENAGQNVKYTRYEEDENLKERNLEIESIKPGESVTKEYDMTVKEIEGAGTTTGKITITADDQETKEYNTLTNPIKQAELKLQIEDKYELEENLKTGGTYPFFLNVTNISGKEQKNITLKYKVPEGFQFDSGYLWEAQNDEYRFVSYENNILTIEILKLDANQKLQIRSMLSIDSMDTNEDTKEYGFIYSATVGENTYYSNERTETVYNMTSTITAKQTGSIQGDKVKNGDNLTYTIEVSNEGPRYQELQVNDLVPTGAIVKKVTKEIYEGNKLIEQEKIEEENNNVSYLLPLQAGQTAKISIETVINTDYIFETKITNKVNIIAKLQTVECNDVEYQVEGAKDPVTPDNPDNPITPDNPDTPETDKTYKISGVAWVDSNKNGLRETSEELLKDIEVMLIDAGTGKIVTNEDETDKVTKTDSEGKYEFSEVKKGTYLVAFRYNNVTYRVTQYQTQGASENANSDVISKKITLSGKEEEIAITGNLKLENQDLVNIDAGFIKNEKFDLRLDKSINKVIVQNSKGTTVHQYSNTQFAKIELDAKQLVNSTVIIEYNIQVTNEGEIAGYVSDIVDYKPTDVTFSSEMNKNWYQSTDGQLHTKELANQSINPGETKNVTLTLVKRMTQENTGTTINTAEISQASNALAIVDNDSTPANKVQGEDDMSTAELLISIKTGGAMMYIALITIIIAVVGLGSYIIKKRVLTEE